MMYGIGMRKNPAYTAARTPTTVATRAANRRLDSGQLIGRLTNDCYITNAVATGNLARASCFRWSAQPNSPARWLPRLGAPSAPPRVLWPNSYRVMKALDPRIRPHHVECRARAFQRRR